MRTLSEGEHKAVLALSAKFLSDREREQLIVDIENCLVEEVVPDGSRLRFHIRGYQRPEYRGQHAFQAKDGFPAEGVVNDADGVEIDVWLFSDPNNRILEIELNKRNGEPILDADWSSFSVSGA
jgi:hypothetical protein